MLFDTLIVVAVHITGSRTVATRGSERRAASTTFRRLGPIIILQTRLGKFFHERIEFLAFDIFGQPEFFFGHFIFIRFAQGQGGGFEGGPGGFELFFLCDRVPDRCGFAFVLLIHRGGIQTAALEDFFAGPGVTKQITTAGAAVLTLSCRTGFELERFLGIV